MNEELKIIISAEVSKLKQGVENAKQQLQGFSGKVEEAKKQISEKFKQIGESVSNAAKTMGAGILAIGAAIVGVVSSTEEYRNQQALLVSAFEAAGASADAAKETYNGLYRVMGDSGAATEAAQSLARLTADEQALGEYTTALTGIFATYGEGMPIETIAEAAAETAATGTVTGDLSRALVEAGVNEEAFNDKLAACNSEAEREKLIRTTLTSLYGDAAKTYEENNKKVLKQREAQAKLQDALAKVGDALAPVITEFTALAAEVLEKATPYIKQFAEKILPKLKPAMDAVVNGIRVAIDWIGKIIEWVKQFATGAVNAWNTVKTAFSNIVGFFSGIWNNIKSIFSNIGNAIANAIKGAVTGAINAVLSNACNIINGFISAINFAIGIINAIPGVNISKLNKLSVPKMAKGGVVDSATLAVIGEQGKEAVLPLENNLEYLDKLAGMISDRMGGGNRPIVLNVDGKRFAEISVESINNLTRQRGSIPLVIA